MIEQDRRPISIIKRISSVAATVMARGGPWVALLVLIIVASALSPAFLRPGNVLRRASPLGIAAMGQTFVILTGGIDLSVGSVISLTNVLGAALMRGRQDKPVLVIGAVLLIGAFHDVLELLALA